MAQKGKTLTFRVPGRSKPLTGVVKNPKATLGAIASKVAAKMGLAGTFEMLTESNDVLSPETPLADLPQDQAITLAAEFTPA
jgi:hypothetical protein